MFSEQQEPLKNNIGVAVMSQDRLGRRRSPQSPTPWAVGEKPQLLSARQPPEPGAAFTRYLPLYVSVPNVSHYPLFSRLGLFWDLARPEVLLKPSVSPLLALSFLLFSPPPPRPTSLSVPFSISFPSTIHLSPTSFFN